MLEIPLAQFTNGNLGRAKGDPNTYYSHAITKKHKRARPASDRMPDHKHGGKIRVNLRLTPLLYEQIRTEAADQNCSLNRILVQWLEAAAAYFEEER